MGFLTTFLYAQFLVTPPVPKATFNGKTVIVTGSNIGLGKEAARWIASLGASKVILACRNVDKGREAAADIETTTRCPSGTIEVWPLDLSSYDSIRAFAARAKNDLSRLDVLISNAGLIPGSFKLVQGNEETFQTNVISLFFHAFLLLPLLHETAEKYKTQTHFTVTSSELYEFAKFEEGKAPEGQIFEAMNDEAKLRYTERYSTTKLMEVLVVKQMAKLYPVESKKVIMNTVAPGLCHSGLGRSHENFVFWLFKKVFARETEVGARTLVHGASAGSESHGQYVPDCKVMPTAGATAGKEGAVLQERVWTELKNTLEGIQLGVTDLS